MSAVPVIAERRRDAETRFAAEGVPHRRIEAWHYTDLSASGEAAAGRAVDGSRRARGCVGRSLRGCRDGRDRHRQWTPPGRPVAPA